ncbi:broad specificity phosphatase PhoE [Diaminobutyricimonas aerilata]|uniref:Broad specificity phosphatase PhoE n=1 Tax=Diaminobutyricimonas aerilata TaxID=1162967 RepID=A0A2M9CL52_9MICO|nr:histidine phosphatase family protein [Diaminobutyricimonas aerilata]PJJ72620.1 broad specificity phosphatase PhoE [Diaminobutyricimonas aerilata]
MVCFFVTHPEVVIDPAVPVERWGLSDAGRARAGHLPEVLHGRVDTIISSAERKATETAAILADSLGLTASVDPALGEMDRSATGYLPPEEFEPTVDAFFAHPELSVRGWERALDAQRRIEGAVRAHARAGDDDRVAFVAHGGVGALLLASLTSAPISRSLDQPGLGSCFRFDARAWRALGSWRRIE